MLERLKQILSNNTFLGPKDIVQLLSIAKIKRVKKGDVIVRTGERNYNAIQVIKGLLRSYTISDNDEEITLAFVPERKHIGSYKTIIANEPSVETIVALEDSWISFTDTRAFEKLAQNSKAIMRLQNKTLKELLKTTIENMMAQTVLTAEQRYVRFCETYPDLQQRVAQKYLASYLGITPTSLSRIRARMTK